jgi:hypothetical protein
VYSGINAPTIRRKVLPPSSESKRDLEFCRLLLDDFFHGLVFDSEDGDTTSSCKIGGLLSDYTASCPRRQYSPEHQIQHNVVRFKRKKRKPSLPPASAGFLLGLIFDAEDGSDIFLRNIGISPN